MLAGASCALSLVIGIVRVCRGDIQGHQRALLGSWIGSVVAFASAVAVPSRSLPTFALEHTLGALAFAVSVVLTTILVIAAGTRLTPKRQAQPRVLRTVSARDGGSGACVLG